MTDTSQQTYPAEASPSEATEQPAKATEQPAQDVPKDALEAQTMAFVEEAEDAAKAAEHNAKLAVERANKMNETASPPPGEDKEEDRRPRDAFGNVIVQPGDVVVRTGPRNENRVTTEEDRLIRHKDMVRGHLRNADPDMTGGKGEEQLDPSTGLPQGHVPEGYQDAPSEAAPPTQEPADTPRA